MVMGSDGFVVEVAVWAFPLITLLLEKVYANSTGVT